MEFFILLARIIATVLLLRFIVVLKSLFDAVILTPERLRSNLRKQGIQGPPPYFLLGNLLDVMKIPYKGSRKLSMEVDHVISHNGSSVLFPFSRRWKEQYGSTYMFSVGNVPVLCGNDPNLVKEISICTSLDLGRSAFMMKAIDPLVGQGVVNSNGALWAHQRKIIAPEFYMDKVKGMMKIMVDSAITLVNSWNRMIAEGGGLADIKIDHYMRRFSGDVISRACFGSNYAEGEQIFLKLGDLQEIAIKTSLLQGIPGFRYLPTWSNRKMWRLQKEIRALILKVVKERKEAASEKELLQLILEAATKDLGDYEMDDFIVDNCKSIYLAGYETTAVTAVWTLMLLALHPEWQDRVRTEAVEICAGELPDANMVHKMKTLTMVINESLRLYPPFSAVSRETLEDIKFGSINVPKGVNIWILVVTLHQECDIWGPDANKFNPERFINGVSEACKFPHTYMPFGLGPHTCLGQQLALLELKVLLSIIVSNFTFSISPKYRHFPCMSLATEPEFGVDLLVRKL